MTEYRVINLWDVKRPEDLIDPSRITRGMRFAYDGTRMVKEEFGLAYFGARWYNADMGRFISCDPISTNLSSPQNLNKYHYCLNNPVNYTDLLEVLCIL